MLVFSFLATLPSSFGQTSCDFSLSGRVVNAETGEPIPFANVLIKSLNVGTVSDDQGRYTLSNLCAGDYTVVCSRIDCDHAEHVLSIADHAMEQDFYLHLHAIELGVVEVRGEAVHLHAISGEDQLNKDELSARQGLNLGQSLKKLP